MNRVIHIIVNSPGSCSLYYLTQPPEELPCNPYYPNYELVLECNVARNPQHPSENFIVEWYTKPNGQSPERIVDGTNGFQVETTEGPNSDGRRSLLRFSNATMQRFSAGQYWCQLLVSNPGSGVDYVPIQSSQMTVILEPEDYVQLPPAPTPHYTLPEVTVPIFPFQLHPLLAPPIQWPPPLGIQSQPLTIN